MIRQKKVLNENPFFHQIGLRSEWGGRRLYWFVDVNAKTDVFDALLRLFVIFSTKSFRKKMGGEEFSHKYRDQLVKELEEAFLQYKVGTHTRYIQVNSAVHYSTRYTHPVHTSIQCSTLQYK